MVGNEPAAFGGRSVAGVGQGWDPMAITQGYGDVARNAGERGPVSAFSGGLLLLLGLCILGVAVGLVLQPTNSLLPDLGAGNTTAILYLRQDAWWLAAGIAGILYLRQRMGQEIPASLSRLIDRYWPSDPRLLAHTAAIAVAVFALVGVGAYWAGHGINPLAGEQIADFQSLIFREGAVLATVPADRVEFGSALIPPGGVYDPGHGLWGSAYPMAFAALRAVFLVGGIEFLTNAALAAFSIVLLVAIARQLWPDRSDIPLVAAILLAASPQFLIGGMAGGAWSAYLCLNLMWLWLYLRGGALGHLTAALVGVVAALLDQILIHLVFVLPFIATMLRERRWSRAAPYLVAYAAAGAIWLSWYDVALSLTVGAAVEAGEVFTSDAHGLADVTVGFFDRGVAMVATAGIAALRFVAWQNPVLVPLIFVTMRARRALPPVFRQLAWGCLLSLVLLLGPVGSQSGWGHLPFHGVLGGMILLATLGWSTLFDNTASKVQVTRALAMLTAATILIGIPLRTAQVGGVVGPLAATARHISSLDSDVVLIDLAGLPFGSALMRNDPYLRETPLIIALQRLTPEQVVRLCAQYRVDFIDYYDVARFGVEPSHDATDTQTGLSGRDRELRAIATSPRCNAG